MTFYDTIVSSINLSLQLVYSCIINETLELVEKRKTCYNWLFLCYMLNREMIDYSDAQLFKIPKP